MFILFALAALGVAAVAQELEIAVSPSPVGSGARAAGMADAFVAIADDATAASWNPAGLVQLERPEISMVGACNAVFEEFSVPFHKEMESKHHDQNVDLNYLSAVYPLPFLIMGRNAVVSLNYQRKYDFSRQFSLDLNNANAATTGTVLVRLRTMDFEQEGGLSTITPAFAIEVTHRLSIGVAVNFWRSTLLSDNSWEQTIRRESFTMFGADSGLSFGNSEAEYKDFSGENITVGVLWNVTDKWSLGARYDSAFTGEADYEEVGSTIRLSLPSARRPWPSLPRVTPTVRKETRHIRFPETIAVGAAYRMNDRLTFSMDVTRTDWNDFWVKNASGIRRSLVDFSNLEDPWTHPRFDDTFTVRFGAEYVCIPKQPEEELDRLWTFRGGLFYDEEPATGRSESFSLFRGGGSGDPDKFYGFAVGCGLLAYQRVNIDAAYQMRYGNGVNRDFIRGVKGFDEDVFQHRFLLSTVVYF